MNWEAIGAIAELLGALAVFASLIFVAIQIRHSRRSTDEASRLMRSQMLRNAGNSIAEFGYSMASDPQIASVWVRGCAGENLDIAEQSQFFWLVRNFVGQSASAYYDYDLIGDQVSRDGNARICARVLATNPGAWEVWLTIKSTAFSELGRIEFIDAIETYAKELGENT